MNKSNVNQLPRTIGFDLGAKTGVYCVLDESGSIVEEGSVGMSRAAVTKFFRGQPTSRVILEASGSSRWTTKIARSLGHEVVIGNPRKIKYITKSVTKSDHNDAFKLADLGQVRPRLLSPVHLRSDKAHSGRMHQRVRAQLVACRTSLINCARGCARSLGHALPKCSPPAFVKRAKANLPKHALVELNPLLDQLSELAIQIKACDQRTESLGEEVFPETKIFQQIAGVGPVLALSFACMIDDPTIFKDSRAVGAFAGLAPKSKQSGKSSPELRISKQGDGETRRLLVSAATYILGPFGPDCDLKRYGQRIASGGSQAARAKARIAVARKLSVLLHRLWMTGEEYQPFRKGTPGLGAAN